jgi:hypothetical protein
MTEQQWTNARNIRRMLEYLEPRGTARKFRLLACACCRQWRDVVRGKLLAEMVDYAESFADDLIEPVKYLQYTADLLYYPVVAELAELDGVTSANKVVAALEERHGKQVSGKILSMIHEIFGNPFRPIRFDAAWRTPEVLRVAEEAYDRPALFTGRIDTGSLAVLSDALEDAGCAENSILSHLRGTGTHVRGCWVVDACLGQS